MPETRFASSSGGKRRPDPPPQADPVTLPYARAQTASNPEPSPPPSLSAFATSGGGAGKDRNSQDFGFLANFGAGGAGVCSSESGRATSGHWSASPTQPAQRRPTARSQRGHLRGWRSLTRARNARGSSQSSKNRADRSGASADACTDAVATRRLSCAARWKVNACGRDPTGELAGSRRAEPRTRRYLNGRPTAITKSIAALNAARGLSLTPSNRALHNLAGLAGFFCFVSPLGCVIRLSRVLSAGCVINS